MARGNQQKARLARIAARDASKAHIASEKVVPTVPIGGKLADNSETDTCSGCGLVRIKRGSMRTFIRDGVEQDRAGSCTEQWRHTWGPYNA